MLNLNFRTCGGSLATKIPTRATARSAGYDLYSPIAFKVLPGAQCLIKLDIIWAPESDQPFFAKIFDKSGLANKYRFNTRAGVIDADYPDEWGLICVNESENMLSFQEGDKLAQFVLLPYLIADDLPYSEVIQRDGGFGSTGR